MFLQRLQTVLYFSLCVSLSWCREGESNVQNQLDNLNAIKNAVDPANGGPQNVGGPANLVQGPPVDDSDIINLAEHPLCAQDVRRLCHDIPLRREGDATKQAKNSLDVLECFLNHDDKAVSADCHQVMWDFKKNVTKDKRIAGIADAQCATDLMGDLSVCSKYHADPGHFISCLVEEKQKVKNEACLAFINKVAVVVFSDYRLVSFFTEACDDDIKRLRCGFLDNRGQAGHSQGAAISCLVHTLQQEQQLKLSANQDPAAKKKLDEIGQISEKCGHEVMRLMELQADDFHLDRTLFFACRDDRETFCHDIQSGQGRVYQCLMKNIANERMSTECKEQLRQREVAAQTDYKVDYGVAHSCQNEIQTHSCIPPSTYKQEFGLSYVILCLEGAIHKQAQNVQKAFSPQCMQALYQQRQAMMSDYNLTPQIVVFCKTDIEEHCSRGVHPTAIVHCLMGVAKEQVKVGEGKDVTYQSKLGPVCGREIQQLMLVADPAADVKVDVVLYKACGNIIEARCGGTAHSPAIQIMGCLMENMHAEEMTAECEKHLLETHYFVTRDIRLDAQLFAACKDEAVNRCNLKDNWSPEKKDMAPESGPMTFACLYRHALGLGPDKTGLSEQCLAQVKATLHQRAIAMDIPPEVDVNCIHDLAYFCSDRQYRKGQEMNCLQSNYAKLQDVCKTAVQHYSQAQDKDVKLSTTYQNCAPMLAKYCPGLTPQSTFDDAMDCLIPHKEEAEMSKPCAAEIEHYQMVNIQEFHLNYRFKESCKTDMETFCAETASKDIGEMVLCLSSINREDTVENEGKAHRISSACRKQLRSELLRRAEKIELDPAIAEACRDDIPKVCPKVMVQGNLLECLRTKTKDELSAKCHAKVFKVEMVQAADEYADFALVKVCRRMIKKYCPDEEGHKLLPCLIAVKKEPDMDPKCAKMIKTRQMEEAKDVRLNPSLYKGCHEDLRKFCSAELTSLDNLKAEAAEIEAKVLNCLRKNKKKLSDTCTKEITHVEKEVVLDYKMDPHLADVCKSDIAQCKDDDEDEKGKVVECLKNLMKAHKLKDSKCALEISRLVADGKADIHVDPNLYMACQLDLKKLCFQILPGEGRQFQCLVDAMDDNHKLGQVCATKLKERIDFVKYASEIEPIENMEQLVESVMESHAKYYFLSVMGGALCAVLCIGICCGRATKRIRRDLKNR